MADIPSGLKYTATHEWVEKVAEDQVIIGLTRYAEQSLGDIVFVELPEVGTKLNIGKEFGVVESVKAASDLYSPMSGKVIAVNEKLTDNPALINQDPYHDGWLIKIVPDDIGEWDKLMDAEEYTQTILLLG
ncbi:MAG: glycine cleavage system protein GcvH [Candidatus Berkiellales bacterium]